ncbi:unnamed protein product [Cochlearia groenlandica]
MDFLAETEPEINSHLWLLKSKSLLSDILTEINQNVEKMQSLIENNEPSSTDKFLCLYQSLGETYNDFNQELLKCFTFDIKMSSLDQSNVSSLVTPLMQLSSFESNKTTCDEMVPMSSKLNDDFEKKKKDQSGLLFADIFCAELETAQRELEARNIDIETEKRRVLELESKLLDSSGNVEILESEIEVCRELLEVSEAEVSKLVEMLSECKAEKAKLQTNNGDSLDILREELRSRDVQIEQMEEYLNQVCVKDTELMSESGTGNNVVEELKARVEELEKQVELQRSVISEREEEKREAIRELCFSLDHYMSKYKDLVRSLSATPREDGL